MTDRYDEIDRMQRRANELRCYADALAALGNRGSTPEFVAQTRQQAKDLDDQAERMLADLRLAINTAGLGCDMDPRY